MFPSDGIALDEAAEHIKKKMRKTIRIAEGVLHNALRTGSLVAWGELFDQNGSEIMPVPRTTWDDLITKQFHSYTLDCAVPKNPIANSDLYKGHFKTISVSIGSIDEWLKTFINDDGRPSFDNVKIWLIECAQQNGNQIPSRDNGWEQCQRHFGARKVNNATYRDVFKQVCDESADHRLTPPLRGRKKNSEKHD